MEILECNHHSISLLAKPPALLMRISVSAVSVFRVESSVSTGLV